ncbi:sigma-54 factor interaction domain-containing protein [Halopseudomonas pachastrellae]|nr:sigma-54 factor interaction domain-containing protein [Halopseudomonas pachastrellae]
MDHFLLTASRLLENRRLRREVQRYRSIMAVEQFHGIIGQSSVMRRLFQDIRQVADADGPVLIQGESGTGKELVARAVHEQSSRKSAPYMVVNCGGIPSELMESEFFGHAAGAYTGARKNRAGLFQQADGGTLLLDEIGEMPLALQAKLLRALQDGKVRPVGSDHEIQLNVRVIAATNRQLTDCVADGSFREDRSIAWKPSPCRCRPCASGPMTFTRWPTSFWLASTQGSNATSRVLPMTPAWRCSATPFRATCASCKTPWSALQPSAPAT